MVITAENLDKIENLIPAWNKFCDIHGWEDHVYNMDQLDEELENLTPTEILQRIGTVNTSNDYFYWHNGWLYSGDYGQIMDNVIDSVSLAKDISKDPGEYRDIMEAEEFAEVMLYSTELDEVEWEDLLVVYSALEDIGPVRNWKLTGKEVEALKELKKISTEFTADIDMLLNESTVEG